MTIEKRNLKLEEAVRQAKIKQLKKQFHEDVIQPEKIRIKEIKDLENNVYNTSDVRIRNVLNKRVQEIKNTEKRRLIAKTDDVKLKTTYNEDMKKYYKEIIIIINNLVNGVDNLSTDAVYKYYSNLQNIILNNAFYFDKRHINDLIHDLQKIKSLSEIYDRDEPTFIYGDKIIFDLTSILKQFYDKFDIFNDYEEKKRFIDRISNDIIKENIYNENADDLATTIHGDDEDDDESSEFSFRSYATPRTIDYGDLEIEDGIVEDDDGVVENEEGVVEDDVEDEPNLELANIRRRHVTTHPNMMSHVQSPHMQRSIIDRIYGLWGRQRQPEPEPTRTQNTLQNIDYDDEDDEEDEEPVIFERGQEPAGAEEKQEEPEEEEAEVEEEEEELPPQPQQYIIKRYTWSNFNRYNKNTLDANFGQFYDDQIRKDFKDKKYTDARHKIWAKLEKENATTAIVRIPKH